MFSQPCDIYDEEALYFQECPYFPDCQSEIEPQVCNNCMDRHYYNETEACGNRFIHYESDFPSNIHRFCHNDRTTENCMVPCQESSYDSFYLEDFNDPPETYKECECTHALVPQLQMQIEPQQAAFYTSYSFNPHHMDMCRHKIIKYPPKDFSEICCGNRELIKLLKSTSMSFCTAKCKCTCPSEPYRRKVKRGSPCNRRISDAATQKSPPTIIQRLKRSYCSWKSFLPMRLVIVDANLDCNCDFDTTGNTKQGSEKYKPKDYYHKVILSFKRFLSSLTAPRSVCCYYYTENAPSNKESRSYFRSSSRNAKNTCPYNLAKLIKKFKQCLKDCYTFPDQGYHKNSRKSTKASKPCLHTIYKKRETRKQCSCNLKLPRTQCTSEGLVQSLTEEVSSSSRLLASIVVNEKVITLRVSKKRADKSKLSNEAKGDRKCRMEEEMSITSSQSNRSKRSSKISKRSCKASSRELEETTSRSSVSKSTKNIRRADAACQCDSPSDFQEKTSIGKSSYKSNRSTKSISRADVSCQCDSLFEFREKTSIAKSSYVSSVDDNDSRKTNRSIKSVIINEEKCACASRESLGFSPSNSRRMEEPTWSEARKSSKYCRTAEVECQVSLYQSTMVSFGTDPIEELMKSEETLSKSSRMSANPSPYNQAWQQPGLCGDESRFSSAKQKIVKTCDCPNKLSNGLVLVRWLKLLLRNPVVLIIVMFYIFFQLFSDLIVLY